MNTETDSVLGQGGEQMAEVANSAGTWHWAHTNVYAGGTQIATYDADLSGQTEGALYFHLSDWLGTRRQTIDYAGNRCSAYFSLPYGNGLSVASYPCLAPAQDPTEHHFTGKERDSESGNDYFGARYYSSSMGRFMSPDPSQLYFADPTNPQSLNLYSYVQNNPLANTDPTGEECVWDDGSFDSADDPNTGSQTQCEGTDGKSGAGGHWVDPKAFATLGLGDWSATPNSTLVGMMGQLQDSQSVTVSATTAAVDVTTSSVGGLVEDLIQPFQVGPLDIPRGVIDPESNNPYLLFHTKYCGPGGGGNTTGFLDAACKAHDDCYRAAGINFFNNLPGGPSMSSSQASSAKGCNQALYNAARINNSAPGSKAAQYWLTQGASLPFGAYIIKPGTEATPW